MPPLHSEASDSSLATHEVNEIDGGEVVGWDERIEWRPEKHRAETTSRIAYVLIGIFAASFLVHYVATVWLHLADKSEAANSLESIFKAWLPVVSGFVGGAVTYYFTRQKS